MELRAALQIQTVLKALTEVVLPAIEPHNKLAQEQARCVVGMLNLLAKQLPLVYRYDRDELSRFLTLATTLKNEAQSLPGAASALQVLASSIDLGEDVLERAQAEPSELEAANVDLRKNISDLITAIYAKNGTANLKQMSTIVMAHAKEQTLRERSWVIAQGWDDPNVIPPIETLIGDRPLGQHKH